MYRKGYNDAIREVIAGLRKLEANGVDLSSPQRTEQISPEVGA